MSNDHLADKSLNPTSISDLTGTNVSEGMQRALVNNAIRQLTSMVKADFAANAGTITSASTLTLASISTGDYILLTPSGGSSSITSFGTATEGLSKALESLGTVILRNSSNLLLPGGSDLTISTGDVIYTRAMGSAVHKVTHDPYNGIPQSLVNAASATVSTTTKLLAMTGGVQSTALVSEINSLAGNTPYLALTAAHTISSGNRNAILDFTTAGVTVAFETAASLSSGFMVTVMNTAASGDVTLNPDGVETLDGLSTRLLRPGDRVEIVNTGTAFKTVRGRYTYTSADTAYSLSSFPMTFAHGLGIKPTAQNIGLALVNTAVDLSYSAGETINLNIHYAESGSSAKTMGVNWDATNVNLVIGTGAIHVPQKSTGVATAVDPTKWALRVTAVIPY